jgi:uncharacterized protein involved in exopolysaccharide biosynthesis
MEQKPYYEDEIDLRQYIDTLLAWWKEIVAIAVVCALAAGVVSTVMPPTYEATATVAMLKERSTVNLGSALETLTEEDLAIAGARFLVDPTIRRKALAQLVSNPTVAELVIEALGAAWFETEEERDPSRLVRQVEGEAVDDADLIRIIVSDGDPQRAATLATMWTQAYVQYVNRLYSSTTDSYEAIAGQLQTAESTYERAQTALEAFIQENRVDEFNRLIAEKQTIRERLQEDKQTVLTTLFDQDWDADMLTARFNLTLASRAFASEGGLSKGLHDRMTDLARDYGLQRRYERQLIDVERMREQLDAGGDPSSNALAVLLMKTEIFETTGSLPGNLQLQLGGPISQTLEAQQADLAALETVLGARIAALDSAVEAEYEALSDALAYGFDSVSIEDPADYVNATVVRLEKEVQALEAELEAQQAQERELRSQRDLAWESYQTLARREAELRVDREVPSSEVRFASPAAVPQDPASPQRLRNTALAGVVGGMLGVFVAFLMSYLDQKPFFSKKTTAKPAG